MSRFDLDLPGLDLMAVARACARYPRSTYPDLLARAATSGADDAAGLLAKAREAAREAPDAESDRTALRGLRARLVAGSALVRAGLLPHGGAIEDVAHLLELAHRASAQRALPPVFQDLWLDALYLAGTPERFPYPRSADVDSRHWRVTVDEMNPFLDPSASQGDERGARQAWLIELSRLFTADGLSPLELGEGEGPPLHRVSAAAPPDTGAGLVTVVMPAFDPEDTPPFALSSVLRQTWTDLEVLLCDDGSGPRGRETLSRWAQLDPRVRLLRSEVNHGAYAARNVGLEHARGEFVTFQDIDDWSHPERVARQVAVLRSDPNAMGTLSRMARVDDRLGLTVLGYAALGVNASSVLFRRLPVLSRLGGFDSVRRAGDNEFLGRLRAVFGSDALLHQPEILALVRRTQNSLSRNDHRLLYRDPARARYRACYRRWHEHIGSGHEDPLVLPPARTPLPAPAHVSGTADPAMHREIAVLASTAQNAPTSPDLAAEVAALAGTGRSLAVVEFPAPFDLSVPAQSTASGLVDLVNASQVAWLTVEDTFHADVAVIRDPAAVTHLASTLTGASISEVVLVADYTPARHYDAARVEGLLTQANVSDLRWLPATTDIAAELTNTVSASRVLPPQLWGVASPVSPMASRPRVPARLGVPTPSTRLAARDLVSWAADTLPRDHGVEVWCRTPLQAVTRQLDRPVFTPGPARWSSTDILREVGYVTLPPTPGRGPHLHPEAVLALQHDCVLLLDAAYRPHFRDAALYLDEGSCQDWIDRHAADRGALTDQHHRAQQFLRENLSEQALRTIVDPLLRRVV